MSNIINDIVDEVEIKPSKSGIIIKWIVGSSFTLIVAAFTFGSAKSNLFNRLDLVEKTTSNNSEEINKINLKLEVIDAKQEDTKDKLTLFEYRLNLIPDFSKFNLNKK